MNFFYLAHMKNQFFFLTCTFPAVSSVGVPMFRLVTAVVCAGSMPPLAWTCSTSVSLTGDPGHEPTLAVAMGIILDLLNTKFLTQAQPCMHHLVARLPRTKILCFRGSKKEGVTHLLVVA
jgi:hypothetical protein